MSREAEVTGIVSQLDSALAPRTRAYARVVQAMGLLDRNPKQPQQALDALQQAQRDLADLWLVRFLRGVAYVEAGAYAEGLSELELCEKRRGEATAIFLDDVPSYRYMVPLSYWLGRVHEGLRARDAAERHYKAYLALRSPAMDRLAKDAALRVASK